MSEAKSFGSEPISGSDLEGFVKRVMAAEAMAMVVVDHLKKGRPYTIVREGEEFALRSN